MKTVRYVLGEGAQPPSRSYPGDAGWDLYTSETARVPPGGTRGISTKVFVELPPGFYGRITGRSSTLRQHGLVVSEGIIDNGYRSELLITVRNVGHTVVWLPRGVRLAQLLLHRIHDVEWEEVLQLGVSTRGQKGFGSSGL